MAIKGLSESDFRAILKGYLTPSRPISSPQHLKGRAKALSTISKAFNSVGKHIFIYGDRGVGKTSIAKTAAIIQQSSDSDPLLVQCGAASFLETIRDAVKLALPASDTVYQPRIERKLKAGIAGFGYDASRSLVRGVVPKVESVNDAVQLLRFVGEVHSRDPVLILDEFDQIGGEDQKRDCARLLKQVSDTEVNVRFVLCGIGTSLEDLIGVHLSSGRYLSPIEIDRLTHDARWEIIIEAAKALGVTVGQNFLIRAGQISDGFPYYIHLIGEHILWSMFEDSEAVGHCFQKHFNEGVSNAVSEAETTIRIIYDKATQKYLDDYREVLWAIADTQLLRRQTTEIYQKSYMRIMEERPQRKLLSKEQFSSRLNSLKTARHGEIIVGRGNGWYEFKENIVRGYVRLRAENEGIQLGVEGYA